MILWRNIFRQEPYSHRSFAELWKHLLRKPCPLTITHVSDKELSADSLPPNRRFLFWYEFNSQLWSDQNRKFWPVVIFREAVRPCATDVMKFNGLFASAKVQLTTYNENNKARCKKYFLFVKMTIPKCVNRELLRMKSTAKQENNRDFEKNSRFIPNICSDLSPGVCNNCMPWQPC